MCLPLPMIFPASMSRKICYRKNPDGLKYWPKLPALAHGRPISPKTTRLLITTFGECWATHSPETKRISHFIQRIIHPDDQEKISKELSRIKHSGSKTFDTLLRFKASDGTYRWIRALGVVLKQNNQRLVERLIGIYIDMTSEIQATQKLNRTKELLEIAEQLIAVGSFELNLNTNKIQWTKGMYQIWEVPVDENPPSCEFLKSYISEEDIKRIGASIEECKRTGTPTDLVYHIYMPDGLKKTIHAVYKTSEKAPAWIFGTLRDITEAQAAQKQLIASEKNYRLLTETIPHIVWRMDPQGNVLYINKYGQNFFGRSHNESKPWKVRDYTSQEDYDRINSIFEEISEKKIPFQHSLKIRHKNGNYYWFQVLLTPHLNNDQEIESWTAVANNIHEQVEAQRSLLQANRRMRSLIDASPVAIYSISVDGIVKNLWNPAAEQLLGWKREEVLGKFIPHVGDNIEDFRAALNEVLTTGQTQRTLKRIKKNGEEVILEANGGAVFDEHGKVEEILVTVMDITELITKREQLQESLKEKNTLLQEIHHRVKNNLAIVVGLLQLQAYQSNIPSEKNHLIDAQNRIKSIAMVHELLYSTEEFSKVNLRTYYQRLVDSIRSNMHIHAREIQQTLAINIESLNITQAIPLGLLINELLTNSLKYAFPNPSPNDHIHLLINKQDTTIYVEYWDNGIGFSMTSSHFKPGLGFKIMDSLLQQLEAEYELEAEEGFRIRFQFQEKLPD